MSEAFEPDGDSGRPRVWEYPRKALSELLNGHTGISPEMALRLEKAFGGSAESWLHRQMQYDLWQAQKRAGKLKVKRFELPLP